MSKGTGGLMLKDKQMVVDSEEGEYAAFMPKV